MDTLVFRSDEGRGYQRNVLGNWKQVLIQEYPNKETSRTTSWIHREERAYLVNWNILVTRGKESKSDSLSSGERNGISLNSIYRGLWDNKTECDLLGETDWMLYHRRWKSCNQKHVHFNVVSQVGRDTWNPFWICEDHLVRLNIPEQPIVNQYREGKVKRTPGGEWNRTWNRKFTSSRRAT